MIHGKERFRIGTRRQKCESTGYTQFVSLHGLAAEHLLAYGPGAVGFGVVKMYEKPKSFSLQDESLEQIERKVLLKVDAEGMTAKDHRHQWHGAWQLSYRRHR